MVNQQLCQMGGIPELLSWVLLISKVVSTSCSSTSPEEREWAFRVSVLIQNRLMGHDLLASRCVLDKARVF